VSPSWLGSEPRSSQLRAQRFTSDLWPLTSDLWPLTSDLWPLTSDLSRSPQCDTFPCSVCSLWIVASALPLTYPAFLSVIPSHAVYTVSGLWCQLYLWPIPLSSVWYLPMQCIQSPDCGVSFTSDLSRSPQCDTFPCSVYNLWIVVSALPLTYPALLSVIPSHAVYAVSGLWCHWHLNCRYRFTLPGYQGYTHTVIIVIENPEYEGVKLNQHLLDSGIIWRKVTGTVPPLVHGHMSLQPGVYSIFHTNPYISFMLHIHGTTLYEGYSYNAGTNNKMNGHIIYFL